MAVRAQIIRPPNGDRSHRSEYLFGAHLMQRRLVAAGTANGASKLGGGFQQLFEHFGSPLVGGGARGHLNRFQIELAALAQTRVDYLYKRTYFARDFLADDFGRFFSSEDSQSSTGRRWQIFSFTSSSSWLSFRKR